MYGYARQNGIGAFLLLGKDIHISDTYVISLEPGLRARSAFQFTGNEGGLAGDPNHSVIVDLHFNIGFAYKYF